MPRDHIKTNSSQTSSQNAEQKAHEEAWKLRYDTYKHLTTLSTGSILLLVTFLEKLFNKPLWKGLVVVALCLFLTSILASLFAMNVLASAVQNMGMSRKEEAFSGIIIFVAWSGFLFGIISMIIFAVKNLYA